MSVKGDKKFFPQLTIFFKSKFKWAGKKNTIFTLFDLRHIKRLRSLAGLLAVSVHDFWWSYQVEERSSCQNVSFPHMSEHYGALNTLPEQTLFRELRRGHIISNLLRVGSLKLMGYADLHTWVMRHISLPLCISTVYFSTVEPGLLNGDLTFTP